MSTYHAFADLTPLKYGLIMADPPWRFHNWSQAGEEKNAVSKYECMTLEDIKALPVHMLAAPDCLLWLWCTNPMLDVGFDVLKAWGFQFKTAGHWVKRTTSGKLHFGTGYILRSAGEPFLIGTIGKPACARNVRSVVDAQVREHSRKPDEAFAAAESLVPNVHRCELFSRQARPGWDVWGNQADMFAQETDAA